MDTKTKKALKKSIAHWQRLEACTSMRDIGKEGIHCLSCALCAMYYRAAWGDYGYPPDISDCTGCPVAEKTGRSYCKGSPYTKVLPYWFDVESSKSKFNKSKWTALARAERKFLESLI